MARFRPKNAASRPIHIMSSLKAGVTHCNRAARAVTPFSVSGDRPGYPGRRFITRTLRKLFQGTPGINPLDHSSNDPNGISRLAIRFVAPVLLSLTVMLVAAVLSIELLSTIRAWVGGESLYSKGQKKATY